MGQRAMRVRVPVTLVLGLAVILLCEALLFVDVRGRGGLVVGHVDAGTGRMVTVADLPEPATGLQRLTRYVATNMTPFCWVGYLLTFDGLLTWLARRRGQPWLSPLRARPNRFVVAWLTSIPVWCYFDYVNFYFMDAWRYHGLPASAAQRTVGYFVAFAAISPGMFLAAEWFQRLGLAQALSTPTGRGVRINRAVQAVVFLLGIAFVVYPFAVRDPVGNLTLWVSLMFLLDPVNHWLGQPSVIGDWRTGRFGRTVSLMLGGALCGLCWEFWNYWATAKWTYHLPFVGSLEQHRYFEMPWIGFQGFLPFAVECWVVLNTIVWLLERLGPRVAERLPDEHGVM